MQTTTLKERASHVGESGVGVLVGGGGEGNVVGSKGEGGGRRR